MPKKHLPLLVVVCGLLLLVTAGWRYPGGSRQDPASKGYSWQHNYLCNLFAEKAINGATNDGRFFAMGGMLLVCLAMALLFAGIARKAPSSSLQKIIAWPGMAAMAAAFLVITSLHDLMTTLGCTLALLALLGIIVMLFQTRQFIFLAAGILSMLSLYTASYVYYSGQGLYWLPVLQKISFFLTITWFLLLHYYLPLPQKTGAEQEAGSHP
ncbi:MAG: hypothetical protein U0X40_07415 [Ferruginibacter sp.]